MWKQVSSLQKCKLLQKNNWYTYPTPMQLEYEEWAKDCDVTYHERGTGDPKLLIKRGWNDQGLWEETYHVWEDEND